MNVFVNQIAHTLNVWVPNLEDREDDSDDDSDYYDFGQEPIQI